MHIAYTTHFEGCRGKENDNRGFYNDTQYVQFRNRWYAYLECN